jgi:hypothetical protein
MADYRDFKNSFPSLSSQLAVPDHLQSVWSTSINSDYSRFTDSLQQLRGLDFAMHEWGSTASLLAETYFDRQKHLALSSLAHISSPLSDLAQRGIYALDRLATEQSSYTIGKFSGIAAEHSRLTDHVATIASDSAIRMSSLLTGMTALSQLERYDQSGLRTPYHDLISQQSTLSNLGVGVIESWATHASLNTYANAWLNYAPVVEPYSSAHAIAVFAPSPVELPIDDEAEEALTDAVDGIMERLASVDRALLEPYGGARAGLYRQDTDWRRQVASSARELMTHLLRKLAPDDKLNAFFTDPSSRKVDGEFTRKAQLEFIFRDIATGSYAIMAEKDIDLVLATFFPTNEVVHSLVTPLDERQMVVLIRRIEGCVSVVLAAGGY